MMLLTPHHRRSPPIIAPVTRITSSLPHAMRIQDILPVPNFSNLFIAILILFVIIRSRGIVDIIPVLWDGRLFFVTGIVLLALLPSCSLTLLTPVEPVDVLIVVGPVCYCRAGTWLEC